MKIYCRKFFYFLFLISSFLLLVTSCSRNLETPSDFSFGLNTKEVKIYFTKSKTPSDIVFVPITRKIPKEDSVVDGALRELFLGPTKQEELKGIMTEVPVGTRLIKVEESEDEILIDVSSQYVTGGGSATVQLRYLQLYKTLNNLEPDKKIYLQIDGKNIKAIGGEGLEITQPLSKINDYTKKYDKVDGVQP